MRRLLLILLPLLFLSCKQEVPVSTTKLNMVWLTSSLGYDKRSGIMYYSLYTINDYTFCVALKKNGKSITYDKWLEDLQTSQGKKIVVNDPNNLE